MIFNIFLTRECNLCCEYCGSCRFPTSLPKDITYSLETLRDFIIKDEDAIIAFYGGEPTLRIELMKRIIDMIPCKHYIIQTNGINLNKIPLDYLKKISMILVSIDGDEQITDLNRGRGTHKKVIESLKQIRPVFPGEIVARMTLSENSDVYRDVKWLLQNQNPKFDGVHWQINFMFDELEKWKDITKWIENYNKEIRILITEWVDTMENESRVQRIYPFMAIMQSLLRNEPTKLRCGAGWIYHTIDTNGNILICPIAGEMTSFVIGNINEIKNPKELYDAALIKNEPCISCDILNLCGGRCLFANYVKPWNDYGYELTCPTIRNLINSLIEVKPRIKELIDKNIITLADFNYIEYNGTEIIP